MKTIGLIGGMSWESSAEYYRILNEEVQKKLGGLHSAKCILFSVDFHEIERLQKAGDWEQAGDEMARVATALEKAGADVILLGTNTMHKVVDAIESSVAVPVLHIADATAKKIREQKFTKVGLLGTNYTMEMDFYKSRLAAHQLTVLIPEASDRERVNEIIFEELCLGDIRQSSKEFYQSAIHKMVQEGAEAVILGCTEIGLLIKPEDSPVPVFDTALIHAQAAVELALNDKSE
ncbi:aspartate/glutamate racemase family protein [Planococcus sp. YIM B11945]|uniref:aspartate/glutamate racemase family protein n=1 Tax=Planococcus sp. YIM B11945 TaxID=3435410 RepID=UPI003D7CF68D